ncbi:MAG: tRNA (guanosine(37)-N1)-methyltransferase TrmD [Patescibacteria group bacterium]
MITFHVVSLFPEVVESYLTSSILRRAMENKRVSFKFYNPRDYLKDPKERADGKPFGGGPGMVIRPEPVIEAVEKAKGRKKKVKIVLFDRKGIKLTNNYAKELSDNYNHIILICGRYEGIDARVYEVFKGEDIQRVSLGSFILTGGEIPAMALIDCVSRQVRGVLGDPESLEEGRPAGRAVYTRPYSFFHKKRKYSVPKVLVSGDHGKIKEWKEKRKS